MTYLNQWSDGGKPMDNTIEIYQIEWNEKTPCPKCSCKVLKESYASVYTYDGSWRDYSHDIAIIECPACEYKTTKILENE